jgi:hypothetical protein
LIPLSRTYNYITNSEAIRRAISHLIEVAHDKGKKVGICGQAPSDDPEFLRFLVREGIDSISLNFDTFARGRINTWRTEIIEAKLSIDDKKRTYEFLDRCDKLIDRIRVPRGKLRNMVRKQREQKGSRLITVTENYDSIFKEINAVSYDFISRINQEQNIKFSELFDMYDAKINQFEKELPLIAKKIREFGIF